VNTLSEETKKPSLGVQIFAVIITAAVFFYLFSSINSVKTSTPTPPPAKANAIDALQIQEGWTWELSRSNNYSYIKGSVKNIDTKPISYFEVRAEYLDDKGNVLDTSYTNSGERINPGAQKRFEIMHKHSDDFIKARIMVSKVVFAK